MASEGAWLLKPGSTDDGNDDDDGASIAFARLAFDSVDWPSVSESKGARRFWFSERPFMLRYSICIVFTGGHSALNVQVCY
jgi:hypothetical protein